MESLLDLQALIQQAFLQRNLPADPLGFMHYKTDPASYDDIENEMAELASSVFAVDSWRQIDAQSAKWLLPYLTLDALCCVLPAILAYNVDWAIDRRHLGSQFIWEIKYYVSIGTSYGSSFVNEVQELRNQLSREEREAVRRYFENLFIECGLYSKDDIDYWDERTEFEKYNFD